MADALYSVGTSAAVALAAATAKTILGVKSHANHGLSLVKVELAFDGATAAAVPVLVEVCYCTWATNSPGTNSTSRTPAQRSGRVLAFSGTAGSNWTAEPTALTALEEFLVHPQTGYKDPVPLGTEPDCAVSEGFAIRCTAPAIVNVRATLTFKRA